MNPNRAVLVGHLSSTGAGLLILIAVGALGWAMFELAGAGAGAVIGAALCWPLWAFAMSRWRRWAVAAGVPVDELQRRGVASGLVGPTGSRFAESEHTANVPLFWGLIVGGFLVCSGLGMELSGSSGSSVHAITTVAFLLLAAAIALDAMQREPPLATWLGIATLFVASAVEWLPLGLSLDLWVRVLIKVLPAIVGIGLLVVLAWIPVRERRDTSGLLPARLSLFAAVGLSAILILVAISGIPALRADLAARPAAVNRDPYSFATGSKLATTTLDDGLSFADIAVGSGPPSTAGDCLGVQYVVWLSDGTRIDSSFDHKGNFTFTLGRGEVIKGWEEGLLGMKVGGLRRLTVPPSLAYGAQGNAAIPPQATLVFVAKVTSIGLRGC